jgi:hypothetical protein
MASIRYRKNEWICRCMINYKYIVIGIYNTEQEAIKAYNEFIIKNNLNRKLK